MVCKSTPSGPVVFAWNDEHQLVASGSAKGEWCYQYDALGRRIAKQRHDGTRADAATWFVWDGLRLAQEVVGEHCITTLYEDRMPAATCRWRGSIRGFGAGAEDRQQGCRRHSIIALKHQPGRQR